MSTERPSDIVIVDDDPIMRELASTKLRESGYGVRIACNGSDALASLSLQPSDLVISDIDMPEMDGFALTRAIRSTQALSNIPVIVITGSDHPEAVEKAFAAGATSFLAKPMNWTLFGQSVRFVLRAAEDEKSLREARDQAQAGARFKDGLMSIMSHELRTPLNAIIGFGQLLGEHFERDNDLVHREYADYIIEGGKRLLDSISDMLLASDARSGPIAINESDCTLGDLITHAKGPLENALRMAQAKLRIALHDPDMEVRVDRQLLARSLGKLIDNAIKFSPPGVEILVGSTLTAGGELAILVRDNGPGVDRAKIKAMAQPFAQSDMSLRRSKEGLGLGLPLVHAISAAHGARFKIDSAPGEGTKVCILLPADRILQVSPLSRARIA